MLQTFRIAAGVAVLCLSTLSPAAEAESLASRWDAQLTSHGAVIPFRLDIEGSGSSLTGTLFNGEQKQTTTSATLKDGVLTLDFAHYLTKIIASQKNGRLVGKVEGRFGGDSYVSFVPFEAKPYAPVTASAANAPRINGLWEIPYESAKGEKAWRFIVRQNAAEVAATILRVDGDTGALTGHFQDGRFVLSHFDGARPLRLEVVPQDNGTLELNLTGGVRSGKYTAVRTEDARAKGLPEPADFVKHTTLRDPNEKFTFRFPDVGGNLVSSADPKFRNKVVLAIITGTWCPNCHDEAQYLVQLYRKYRDQGLEIVALDFEEPEQQDELQRVKAFTSKYGVEYTYLIAGAPAEMWEKVPQAINLNTWPATFFVSRDGRVRKIHAGFAAPSSGEFHQQLKAEFTSTIESLLAEHAAPELSESAGLRD
ncbi:TlpA disulfide reductase family protein [uncultured Paludibaculum sp.]|uniref:peroxiredoxin family protein n=1 Tax=uncultured Paludibaculum sp. TaxID=1765020 RepID=UPI002AAB17AC|nr:TlpA disulfide reductase family protein [uncultured Paludibaculum sp.]